MEKQEGKKRNVTADFLKGVMIFCVLYGHSISMINSLRGVTWQNSVINVFLTAFEMPLFILISGYFLWFSLRKKAYYQVLFQRIISIAIPLLIWEGLPAARSFVADTINEGFSMSDVSKIGMNLVFPRLWFLACYLFCTIFVVLIEWCLSGIKEKKARIVIGSVIYSALIVVLHFVKHSFNNVPFMFPFFLVGFILSKYSLLSKNGVRRFIVVLAACFALLYPFYKSENSFYILGSYVLDNTLARLPIFIYRFVLGFSGCCLFYLAADYLCKKAVNNKVVLFTANLGTKTMELYILSTFIQERLRDIAKFLIKDVSAITDTAAPLLFGPLFLAFMLAICFGVNHLIQKNPKLHKAIFGR